MSKVTPISVLSRLSRIPSVLFHGANGAVKDLAVAYDDDKVSNISIVVGSFHPVPANYPVDPDHKLTFL